MPNYFDQFDEAGPATAEAPSGNFFDQFDEVAEAPPLTDIDPFSPDQQNLRRVMQNFPNERAQRVWDQPTVSNEELIKRQTWKDLSAADKLAVDAIRLERGFKSTAAALPKGLAVLAAQTAPFPREVGMETAESIKAEQDWHNQQAAKTPEQIAADISGHGMTGIGTAIERTIPDSPQPSNVNRPFGAAAEGAGSLGASMAMAPLGVAPMMSGMFLMELSDAYESEIARQQDTGEPLNPGKASAKASLYAAGAIPLEYIGGAGRLARRWFGAAAENEVRELARKGGGEAVLAFFSERAKDAALEGGTESLQRLWQDAIVHGKPNIAAALQEGASAAGGTLLLGGGIHGSRAAAVKASNAYHEARSNENIDQALQESGQQIALEKSFPTGFAPPIDPSQTAKTDGNYFDQFDDESSESQSTQNPDKASTGLNGTKATPAAVAATPAPASASPEQATQVRTELEALPGGTEDIARPGGKPPTVEQALSNLTGVVADLQAALVANQGNALLKPSGQPDVQPGTEIPVGQTLVQPVAPPASPTESEQGREVMDLPTQDKPLDVDATMRAIHDQERSDAAKEAQEKQWEDQNKAEQERGITEQDGILFALTGNGVRLPYFAPGGTVMANYTRLRKKLRSNGILSSGEKQIWNKVREQVPENYEDEFGVDGELLKEAYAAAQEAGIAAAVFKRTLKGSNLRFDVIRSNLQRDTGKEYSTRELLEEVIRASKSHIASKSRGRAGFEGLTEAEIASVQRGEQTEVAKSKVLEDFDADETEASPALEQQQAIVDRLAARNPGLPELKGLRAVGVRNAGAKVQLRPGHGTGTGGKPGLPSAATAEIAQLLERLYDLNIIFVDSAGALPFNGVKFVGTKTVLIHVRAGKPMLTVAGHELLHHIKETHPGLYAELVAAVGEMDVEGYRSRLTDPAYAGKSDAQITEELLADLLGDSLADATFLNSLARQNPNLFKRFTRIAIVWLDKLLAKLKGVGFSRYNVSQHIADIEAARDALRTMLVEAAKETQYRKAGIGEDARINQVEDDNAPLSKERGESSDVVTIKSKSSGSQRVLSGVAAREYQNLLASRGVQFANQEAFGHRLPSDVAAQDAARIAQQNAKPWPVQQAEKYLSKTDVPAPEFSPSELEKYGEPSRLIDIGAEELAVRAKITKEMSPDEIADALDQAATEMAYDQVDAHRKEKDDQDLADYVAHRDFKQRYTQAIEQALGVSFRGTPSAYATYQGLKLRVSDHHQVGGGGYNMQTDKRMGEANVQWVVPQNEAGDTDYNYHIPSPAEIRATVAKALRGDRQGDGSPITVELEAKKNARFSKDRPFHASNATIYPPGVKFSITAHHGTPHKVDKFSTAKIGTGEGAQVYGWGLYFAENPATAKYYREAVSNYRGTVDGQQRPIPIWSELPNTPEDYAVKALFSIGPNHLAAIYGLDSRSNFPDASVAEKAKELIRSGRVEVGKTPGNEYTVTLNVEDEDLLDWDKPLSEQSEKVRKAVGEFSRGRTMLTWQKENGPSGGTFYAAYARDLGRPQLATDYLLRAGIKGIRYLDQGSRKSVNLMRETGGTRWAVTISIPAQQPTRKWFDTEREASDYADSERDSGTYNYVIFSGDDITITHENGKEVSAGVLFSKERGSDTFSFDARESVSDQKARLAAEKRKADEAQAKAAMQERAGAKLTGADVDTTKEMFGAEVRQDKSGQGALFSKERKQTGSKRERNAANYIRNLLWEAGELEAEYNDALKTLPPKSYSLPDIEAALFRNGEKRDWNEIVQDEGDTAHGFNVKATPFEWAKQNHGTTDDINAAGYVLPSGEMLDFSERRHGGGGDRSLDHRNIQYEGRPSDGYEAMRQFIGMGGVRVDKSGAVDIGKMPTSSQISRLRELGESAGSLTVDLLDGKRKASFTTENIERGLGMIRRFYNGEELPEHQALFSKARQEESTSPTDGPFRQLQDKITKAEAELMAAIRQHIKPPESMTKAKAFAAKNAAVSKLNRLLAEQLKQMTSATDAARSPAETAELIAQTVSLLNHAQDEISTHTARSEAIPADLTQLRNDLQTRLNVLKGWSDDQAELAANGKPAARPAPNGSRDLRKRNLESATDGGRKGIGDFWNSLKAGLRYLTSPIPELPLTGERAEKSALFRRGYRLFAVENNAVRKEAAEKINRVLEPLTKLGRKGADNAVLQQFFQLGNARQRAAMTPAQLAKIDARMAALEAELNKDPFDLFRRLVLYRDLWWRGTYLKNEQGKPITLPQGLIVEDVADELRKLTSLIADHKDGLAITEALRRHYALTEELQKSILAHGEIIPESLRNPLYFPHHVIDHWTGNFARVRATTEEDFRKYLIAPTGSGALIQTDYLKAMMLHTADVLAHNARIDLVQKYWQPYDISEQLKKQHGSSTWNKPWNIPPGYKVFTPYKKLPLRMDYILSREVMAEKLGVLFNDGDLRERLGESGLVLKVKPEDLHAALVAGEKIQWVLPSEITDALNGIARREAAAANPGLGHSLGRPLRALNNFWKKTTLFAPWNWIRYEYGNLSTDAIDKVLAADPAVAKHMARAARELWKSDQGAQSPEFKAAQREGVFETITAGEAGELARLPQFKAFLTTGEARWDNVRTVLEAPMRGSKFREGVFRYAKFLADVERLRAGKEPVYAGAFHGDIEALGEDVDGQRRLLDGDELIFAKAAEISLKTYGDYQSLGVVGQWLRQYAIPFWSWQDVNFRYHANQLRNIADGIKGVPGGTERTAALRYAGIRVVSTLLAVGIAKELWNQFGGVAMGLWDEDDDLESKLSEADRRRGHLLLGKDDKGQVKVVYTPSAWSDVAEWMGGQNMKRLFMEYVRGQITLNQFIRDYAKQLPMDVGNKAAQSGGPLLKAPYELASGQATFPDVFDQRQIPKADKWWRFVGGLTDQRVVATLRAAFDQDFYSQPAREQLQQIILQIRRRDPEQWAYYEAREDASDWKEAKTGKRFEHGSYNAPEALALRNFRKSIYRGDVANAERFYNRLIQFGYTAERLDASIRNQHPLSNLNAAERAEYTRTLTPRQQLELELANKYYSRLKALDQRERLLFKSKQVPNRAPNPELLRRIVEDQSRNK